MGYLCYMARFLEIILEVLFLYFLYRLVFDFIIPVYRSSKKIHRNIKEMHGKMQDHLRQQQQQQQNNTPPPTSHKVKEGEYIEYEEVKEKR